mgnify:CR=1 FL=1
MWKMMSCCFDTHSESSCQNNKKVADSDMDAKPAAFAPFKLHRADASVIVLAERLKPSAVLTDDLNLRKALESLGITAVGSVGILIRCFKLGRFGNQTFLLKRKV